MERLEIREYVVTEVARNHPSPSMVYICPKCKVGHKLQHISDLPEKVICKGCEEVYEKPLANGPDSTPVSNPRE